jgi:flagellar assembly factor FliW
VIVKTGSFGEITVQPEEIITFEQGLLGFPDCKRFCLYDAGDDTLILWLQSLDDPQIAFPVLEPRVFKTDYVVRLSALELRELKLQTVNESAVFNVLTIPEDVTQMTANLKAPLVINLRAQVARQVVLQENEYAIKHSMFKELRAHLVTLQSHKAQREGSGAPGAVVAISQLPISQSIRTLQP